MGASGKFQRCFKSVSHVIQEGFKSNFKQVSREVSREVQGSFIVGVLRKFQEKF